MIYEDLLLAPKNQQFQPSSVAIHIFVESGKPEEEKEELSLIITSQMKIP